MKKGIVAGLLLLLVDIACINHKTTSVVNENCPPLKYESKFEAVFIEETSCGDLLDVNLVYDYTNGTCSETKRTVDMNKYVSFNTDKKCPINNLNIYRYEKKK